VFSAIFVFNTALIFSGGYFARKIFLVRIKCSQLRIKMNESIDRLHGYNHLLSFLLQLNFQPAQHAIFATTETLLFASKTKQATYVQRHRQPPDLNTGQLF
jgi:hypothetical protein